MEFISDGLKANSILENLNIRTPNQNSCRFKSLIHNSSASNAIGKEGAKFISEAIKENYSLKLLQLGSLLQFFQNQIDPQFQFGRGEPCRGRGSQTSRGVFETEFKVADSWIRFSYFFGSILFEIDREFQGGNQVGNEGAKLISQGLRYNNCLTRIILGFEID